MSLKGFTAILISAILILSVAGCSPAEIKKGDIPLVDADGATHYVSKDSRVVCAYGSFAECWMLSGGRLVGVTEDAVSERGLSLDADTAIVGTVKAIDLERLISLDPDLVILSADLTAHRQLARQLSDRGIAAPLLRIDSFDDYDSVMKQFCNINGGSDRYREHVTEVRGRIDSLLSSLPKTDTPKTVLVMRAYSTGIKVKTDNIAEDIAKALGCLSLAEKFPSMLTDLSVEAIVASNPDVILVLTMGDEGDAQSYLHEYINGNPALASLDAVKNGNLRILPKELFHYKPNNKWDKSYEYLAKIIYPEAFE